MTGAIILRGIDRAGLVLVPVHFSDSLSLPPTGKDTWDITVAAKASISLLASSAPVRGMFTQTIFIDDNDAEAGHVGVVGHWWQGPAFTDDRSIG